MNLLQLVSWKAFIQQIVKRRIDRFGMNTEQTLFMNPTVAN